MSEEIKERRCLTCKKRLIDGIIPICPRCKLKGSNGIAKIGTRVAVAGTIAWTGYNALSSLFSNQKDDQNQDQENGDA